MGPVAHLFLLCGALFVVLGATTAVVLWLRRRRRRPYGLIAMVIGALSLGVLAVEETAPRMVADRQIEATCLHGEVHTSLSGSPVTWQMLTGGLEVEADVDADQVRQLVHDRLSTLPLRDTTVELGHDVVEVSASLPTRFGTLPVSATVAPRVTEGALKFEPTSIAVAGRALPADALDQLGALGGPDAQDAGQGACSGGLGQLSGARMTAASVDRDGLSVRLRM